MKLILNLITQGIAVFLTAYILPGVYLENFFMALVVALVLGILNAVIKPILFILTLPITIVTLGLFTFILNAFMILIVDTLVVGFEVGGFFNALIFSLVLSIVSTVLHALTNSR